MNATLTKIEWNGRSYVILPLRNAAEHRDELRADGYRQTDIGDGRLAGTPVTKAAIAITKAGLGLFSVWVK